MQATPQSTSTPFVDFPDDGLDLPAYLASIERDLIQRALERTRGNRNKAADLLRIKRTTLVEKLKTDWSRSLMPPRFVYWTIIAGGLPTAFRAAEREELLPTFKRIQEKHPDAEMKWFARGRLWESPEEAKQEADARRARAPRGDARGRDWRPGGEHRDPRQKFKDAKKERNLDWRKERFERRQAGGRTAAGETTRRSASPSSGKAAPRTRRKFDGPPREQPQIRRPAPRAQAGRRTSVEAEGPTARPQVRRTAARAQVRRSAARATQI